jgi:hypothetical protein
VAAADGDLRSRRQRRGSGLARQVFPKEPRGLGEGGMTSPAERTDRVREVLQAVGVKELINHRAINRCPAAEFL